MDSTAASIHLLKHALAFTLWPDPLVPVSPKDYANSTPVKKLAIGLLHRFASLAGLQLARNPAHSTKDREEGRVWRSYPDTMIGLRRLENLQNCVETVLLEGVAGDFIETGAWRGGACIFMRGLLAAHRITDRRVFVADSFEGLPPPNSDAYPADMGDLHHAIEFLSVDLESVQRNFERYGLLDEQVVFLKGWFAETLPAAPIQSLAILRLDGDMYGSTMDALNALYPKLAPGGFCIVDDFHLAGCRQAVEDYRSAHAINEPIQAIDWAGRFWRKS
jgi:O-methyltransferase